MYLSCNFYTTFLWTHSLLRCTVLQACRLSYWFLEWGTSWRCGESEAVREYARYAIVAQHHVCNTLTNCEHWQIWACYVCVFANCPYAYISMHTTLCQVFCILCLQQWGKEFVQGTCCYNTIVQQCTVIYQYITLHHYSISHADMLICMLCALWRA